MAYVPPHLRGAAAPSAAAQRPLDIGCRCRTFPGIYPGTNHAVRLEPGRPLLGSLAQFCAAFYHIEPTPEAGLGELCLAAAEGRATCARKTVACLARLQRRVDVTAAVPDDVAHENGDDTAREHDDDDGGWRDVYTCRYANCWRGDSTTNVHAEKFLTEDAALEAALGSLPPSAGGRLILYL
eukprot:4996890-Prymnesium_polylepis.1